MSKAASFFRDNGLTNALFGVLAVCLFGMIWSGRVSFQRGSPESRDPHNDTSEDANTCGNCRSKSAPWPIKVGGLRSLLNSYSLGIALVELFATSSLLQRIHNAAAANADALHGREQQSALDCLGDPTVRFESFRDWQAEFVSTAVPVVLSISLRRCGSRESKPVADSRSKTGH